MAGPRNLVSNVLVMRLAIVSALVALTGALGGLVAQQTKPALPAASPKAATFEVISIKPIQPSPPLPNFFVEGDKLRGNHVTARVAIAFAYNLNGRQILGGPDWIHSEHYNIDARAGHKLAPKDASGQLQESVAVMLRALLADRFALRARHETREMPVHALVRARSGFTPDEKHLRRARISCDDFDGRLAAAKTDDDTKAALADCFERTGGEMHVRGRNMSRLAYQLGRHLDRTVIDETGLSGLFDVDLAWRDRELPRGPDRRAAERDAILDVLHEQLGMKLEERRAMLPVVVIDSIQRPTPN
jgi:uncharacterized protein (TIGR03435 family)